MDLRHADTCLDLELFGRIDAYQKELAMFDGLNQLEKAVQPGHSGQDLRFLPLGKETVFEFMKRQETLRPFSKDWLKTKYMRNVPARYLKFSGLEDAKRIEREIERMEWKGISTDLEKFEYTLEYEAASFLSRITK